jgi:DNA-binding transcriptional LysR family regulator
MYDVDTALLRSFVLLAETRSFSKTAQRVGRTQSAVSAQLKKLEDLMGATLVERDTRNVSLTADGERLLGYAAQIVAAADAMIQRFRTTEVEGEVRFGSPEDFASAYLPDILSTFAAAHARVLLRASCDLTLHLIDQFERGQHDIVIVKQDPNARYPGARALWREELVWVGPDSGGESERVHAAFTGGGRASRPLPLVLSPAPCVYRSRASAALDAAGVPWRVVYESPSHAGCAAAVKAGLGYSVMPRGLSPEGLAVLPDEAGWPKLPEAEICLLPAARLTPAAAALARYIEARLVRNTPRRPTV